MYLYGITQNCEPVTDVCVEIVASKAVFAGSQSRLDFIEPVQSNR